MVRSTRQLVKGARHLSFHAVLSKTLMCPSPGGLPKLYYGRGKTAMHRLGGLCPKNRIVGIGARPRRRQPSIPAEPCAALFIGRQRERGDFGGLQGQLHVK